MAQRQFRARARTDRRHRMPGAQNGGHRMPRALTRRTHKTRKEAMSGIWRWPVPKSKTAIRSRQRTTTSTPNIISDRCVRTRTGANRISCAGRLRQHKVGSAMNEKQPTYRIEIKNSGQPPNENYGWKIFQNLDVLPILHSQQFFVSAWRDWLTPIGRGGYWSMPTCEVRIRKCNDSIRDDGHNRNEPPPKSVTAYPGGTRLLVASLIGASIAKRTIVQVVQRGQNCSDCLL